MMYLTLVKVFFKENFSLKRIFGIGQKTSKVKTILLGLLIVYGIGMILFSFGFLFFQLGEVFKALDSLDALLTYIFMYATFLSAFFIILRASGYLFHYKDYDFLSSLPIKNAVVLAAKTTVMMTMVYISIYLLTAPMIFSYLYHGGFDLYQLIALIVLILFIPIIPLVIFSFIALGIDYVVKKLRMGKILGAILTFGILIAYMYFAFSFNPETENPFLNQQAFLESVTRFIPTATLFFEAVAEVNLLSFFLFIVINVALLIGFIYLIRNLIHYTNQNEVKSIKRKRQKSLNYKQRSLTEALVKKEAKKFFSSNIYLLNSGFGPILMILGGVLSIFYVDRIQSIAAQIIGVDVDIELMILILVGFLLSTVYTSAISLSLEGKNLWIIRSLPIKAKTVVFSKTLFNVILGSPVALFFVGAVGFSMGFEFLTMILMMILIISFSVATSLIGSVINMYFPKFHYTNDAEVVKQSVGAFLGMFSGIGIIVIFGLLQGFVFTDLSLSLSLLLFTILDVFIILFFYILIDKKAESLFMKYS